MTVEELVKQLRKMTYDDFDGLELINNTSYEIKTAPPFITYDIRQIDTECYIETNRVETYDRMTQNKYSVGIVKITFLLVDTQINFYLANKFRLWLKEMPTQIDFATIDVNYMRDLSVTDNYRYRFDAWFRINELDSRRLDRIDEVYFNIDQKEYVVDFKEDEESV